MLSLQRILEIRTYKTVWVMGHKIRQAWWRRCRLQAGRPDRTGRYLCRRDPNQANVAAALRVNPKSWWRWKLREINHGLPRMRQVPRVSGDEIKAMAQACLAAKVVARTDGWQAYRVLNSESSFHLPTVTGSGKNASQIVSLSCSIP